MNEIELTEEQKVEVWLAEKRVECATMRVTKKHTEAGQLSILICQAEHMLADLRSGKGPKR